jgi:plastocyanin
MSKRLFIGFGSLLGAFAGLALTLASCGGGGGSNLTSPPPPAPPPPAPPPSGAITVEVDDSFFSPRSVVVEPGQSVRWVFVGSAAGHTVTDEGGVFDSGFVFRQAGDVYERTFAASEEGTTFRYRCASHQGCCQMQGSVRVGASAPLPPPGY